MVDQSFDSTQASSQDKYLIQDGTVRQPGYSTNNIFPASSQTPQQQSIDQKHLNAQGPYRSQSQSNLNQLQSNQDPVDKAQMPRPIQMLNTYNIRAGIPDRFPTKTVDTPPSAGIPFIQIDEGQVGPKFMRGTVIQAPIEQSFQTQSYIPFGFLIQPLAEMTQSEYNNEIPDVPLIDYQDEGPFRCHRCKAYVNPFMVFLEGGNKAQCNLCQYINEVPVNYQSQLNEFGQRRDRLQRPELQFGAYEFKAPASYQIRKILNPTYVFVIDVSQFSLPIGFFTQIVQSIKMTLDYIQNAENTQICFITYDINLHFYNLPQDPNGEPSVLWVGETTDPFIPYPREKLMLKLVEDRERIDIFLDKLVNMHTLENKKYQAPFLCTGAAISAARQLLQEDGGRILVFATNINSSGLGQLLYRDDSKAYNTDKEKTLLSPVNDIYIKMGLESIQQRICIDLIYAVTAKSVDVTSIAPVATMTGGDFHLFAPYDPNKHSEKLHYEIFRILTRNQGTEVAIKARTSTGLSVIEYFGGFGVKEVADFELSAIDCDKSMGIVLRNDEKLKEDSMAYIQFAMMYSNQFGERRIRIFNYCLQTTKNLNGHYKAADCETLSEFIIKRETSRVMVRGAKATREAIINNLVTLLYVYRNKCAAQTQPSQLVLPENLKLLPLYILAALKTPVSIDDLMIQALKMFPGVKVDDKIYWMYKLLRMPMSQMPYFLYPRIYKVTDLETSLGQYAEGSQLMTKPACQPATLEKLGSKDAYIIDNGEYIFFYLGNQVDDSFIQNVPFIIFIKLQVFGYANFSDLKFNGITTFVPMEGSDISQLLWQFIEQIRYEKIGVSYQPLRLVYMGDTQEKELIEACLIEDSVDINKEFPYTDFLCMLHKLIRNKTQ